MSGQIERGALQTGLLADADVLIDYRDSKLEVLKLVTQSVGQIAVLTHVLDEVRGVSVSQCRRYGIEVVEVETEQMLAAGEVESNVSFNDRLCLVTCKERGWTCVTNDRALQRLCEKHRVKTRFGLTLMVDLVTAGVLTQHTALAVANQMHESSPTHINEDIINRFTREIGG